MSMKRGFGETGQRIPIGPNDPPEVFVLEANLLVIYSDLISEAVDDILEKFPGQEQPRAAAAAFIAKIGEDIPDETIRGAVKRLATIKFRLRGVT
jgi:hypothetical protein